MSDLNMHEKTSDNNCRLCLSDLNGKTSSMIFQSTESNGPSLPSKIMICLSLPIEKDDAQSNKICNFCNEEVKRFYDFRKRVLGTYYSLWNNCNALVHEEKSTSQSQDDFEELILPAGEEYDEPRIKAEGTIDSLLIEDNLRVSNQCETPEQQVIVKEEIQIVYCDYECSNDTASLHEEIVASKHDIPCSQPTKETIDNSVTDPIAIDTEPTIPARSSSKKKNSAKLLQCSECNKVCKTARTLRRHMLLHAREPTLTCPICDEKFTYRLELNIHLKSHPYRYACKICKRAFLRPSYVEKHMTVHTGEKPFACQSCPKRFTQLGSLKTHELIHKGLKSHSCRICGMNFWKKVYMNRHLCETHNVEPEPYKCNGCGKIFEDYDEMILHNGTKVPKKCQLCNHLFKNQCVFDNHISKFHASS